MKKVVTFIQKNIFFIIIIIVGIAYILTGVSKIIPTGETIESILSTMLLSTVLGWLISAMYGQQAIIDGYDDQDVIAAMNTLANQIEKIEPYIDKLEDFCEKENENIMKRKRNRILNRNGLTYEQFENITKETYKKLNRRQKKAIKKAYGIGYGFLSSDWLLSDIEEKEEDNEKPVSVNKYVWKKNAYNLITKTITGALSGYYILEPFAKANWNIIIWRVFFFAIWLLFGYVRYITDFNFMTKVYRKTIVRKTNDLVKFEIKIKNGEYDSITIPTKNEQPIVQETKDNLLTESEVIDIYGNNQEKNYQPT